jgi:hypothetical protein
VLSLLPTVFGRAVPKPIKEISADEYKVFTDFFNTEKFTGIDVPQFFEYVYKGSVVFEKTTILEKKETKTLGNLRESFGNGVTELINDFKINNKEQYIIKEKILVQRLSVLTEKKQEEAIKDSKELSEVPSRRMSDIIYLSGIGFNKAKNAALFYVLHSGSPRTSYWVLMGKSNNKWEIKKAVMDNMIIF